MLNPDVLPKNLPVQLNPGKCTIEGVEVNIAPFMLFSSASYAIQVSVHHVEFELEHLPVSLWDEAAELEALKAAKIAAAQALRAAAIEAVKAQIRGVESQLAEFQPDSFGASVAKGIAVRVLDNVEVTISDIEVRFRFCNMVEVPTSTEQLKDEGFLAVKVTRISLANSTIEPQIGLGGDSSEIPK